MSPRSVKNKPGRETAGRKVIISRVIHAPCGRVYQAWTEPEQLAQWFSPEEIECRSLSAEVRVGGSFRIHMVSKTGDHIAAGVYKQIIPNQRLQFTWQWESYAMPESVVTVEFEDLGKTTRLTLVHEGFPDQEDADEHHQGWNSLVEKFARLIEQNRIKS
jgi:uncharacterized protein YndB with AHSA1/START domain